VPKTGKKTANALSQAKAVSSGKTAGQTKSPAVMVVYEQPMTSGDVGVFLAFLRGRRIYSFCLPVKNGGEHI
jgi:hypothetical protein